MAQVRAYAQDAALMAQNIEYLQQPYSLIDQMKVSEMLASADTFKTVDGYDAYKAAIAKTLSALDIYNQCQSALNAPFDNDRIVKIRTDLIPLISQDGYFSDAQYAEMDRLDIYLSRYKGSLALFKSIINKINSDPDVKNYRELAKKGRPGGADRKKFIAAISNIVYQPNTKNFTKEINDYINLIPYLKNMLVAYLNDTAQNPNATSAIEAEILSTKL